MNGNGNDQQTKIICVEFNEKIKIDGLGLVWAAEYEDYGGDRIVIIPDARFFVPSIKGSYVAVKPKGYRSCNSYHKGLLVYQTKIFEMIPVNITENGISIFESDFYVPPCFMKKGDYNVFFRTTKIKNQFALIWISDEDMREKIFRYLRKNVPYTNLQINSFELITIEAEFGESRKGLETKIINSITYCKG